MTKRPPIPEPVKRAAIYLNMRRNGGELVCCETGEQMNDDDLLKGRVHFDHNPPLALRYRYPDGTYRPDANDVRYLDVCLAKGHQIRTNKKRGLSPGDQTEIARQRKVRAHTDEVAALNERKAGRAPLDPGVQPKPKTKRSIPSRPFPKGKRPFQSPQSAGGKARAKSLSPERRSEIASKAAKSRWRR